MVLHNSSNFIQELRRQLPSEGLFLLNLASEVAAQLNLTLYLVGGIVRDLLLGRSNQDIDLVVEGDALPLARGLAQKMAARLVIHSRFGTAKLTYKGRNIDLATARSESYAHPGALPAVKAGNIADDLLRRDFSVNAMAIRLSPNNLAELVDLYDGQRDLERRLLRVLHDRSFIDDATRILRALRYEQRLGFSLENHTEQLMRRDVAMLRTITGDRIRHELQLILKEEQPERILERMDEFGALATIHRGLKGDEWLRGKFVQARELKASSPSLYFALMAYRLDEEQVEDVISLLKMPRETARVLRDTATLKQRAQSLEEADLSNSQLYHALEGYSPVAIKALGIACGSVLVREQLEKYLAHLRYVKPSLNGNDLLQLGVPPGAAIGAILRRLREAKLNGAVATRQEEESLVRQWLAAGPIRD